MKPILIACLVLLAGCEPPPNTTDQTVRRQIFMECLKNAPAGPNSTKYSDWDEVVDSCESAAFYQSQQVGPNPIKATPETVAESSASGGRDE